MADILSVDVKEDSILLNLNISKEEYKLLGSATKDILVLSAEDFGEVLTTGRLGHNNRLMLPKKVLKRYGVDELSKRVPAQILSLVDSKFLVVKLSDKRRGIPKFGEADG